MAVWPLPHKTVGTLQYNVMGISHMDRPCMLSEGQIAVTWVNDKTEIGNTLKYFIWMQYAH